MVEGYPDSLASWGAPAIFKEAGRLLGKYFRLLDRFIVAFFLPMVVMELLKLWGVAWGISHHPHPRPDPRWGLHPGPHYDHHHHFLHPHPHPHPHHSFGGYFRGFYVHSHEGGVHALPSDFYAPAPSSHPPPPPPPLLPLLVFFAVSLLVWLLSSLAAASISQAIAHIYSQEPSPSSQDTPLVTKSIFQSLPSALYRIFLTTIFILLFTFLISFLLTLPLSLLDHFFHSKILILLLAVMVQLALFVLGFVFLLALPVSVLEPPEHYGLAALKRSWKLVQSKVLASLIVFMLNILVGGVVMKLGEGVVLLAVSGKLPFWVVYPLGVMWAVLYLSYLVYFLVVLVVLYFAAKVKVEGEGEYLPVNSSEEYTPPVVKVNENSN